ncbi:MAG: V-type ATPase subunit [Candidatus Bathyarchaeia archaeon]
MPEYVIVRCHGLSTRLLPSQVLEAMPNLRSLKDLTDILAATDYGGELRALPELNLLALEHVFDEKLHERYRYVLKVAEGGYRRFLTQYMRRLEVQAMARIMRGKFAKIPVEELMKTLPTRRYLDLDLKPVAEADSVEKAIDLLKATPYFGLGESLPWCLKYQSSLPMEYWLRKAYYSTLLKALKNLPLGNRERALELIGLEIDVANCFTASTPLLYGYTPELVQQLLIPYQGRLTLPQLQEATEAKSPSTLIKLFAEYREIARPLIEDRDEILAETAALKTVKAKAERLMMEGPIDFTYVLGYLKLCEVERRNLVFIAHSINQNTEFKQYLVT